ncbi:MAG TPA: DUF6395 domain-containing protein [Candidatus Avamphibacillus sp.]|nr:DUF6395 domain-containing protein [Candidatus Avamphibacillus sp.]
MIIGYKCQNGKLELKFTPEKDDSTTQYIFNSIFKTTRKVEMGSNQCEIQLPRDWTIDSVHPDAFALAMLAIIYPFSGSQIRLPKGVSKSFHNQVKQITNKKVLPINKELSPRKAPSDGVPALSYSGGIDSNVAAVLLPENTHLFYIDRMPPKGKALKLLNQEAAYYACDSLAKLGRSVHKIKTDMQYIRKPVGFGTYLTDAVPALLLADYYGFDTTGHGQTLEIGYQVGHLGFKECKENRVGHPWHKLLETIDMPFTLPTIGLSEVSTTRIINKSSFRKFAQPCARGKIKNPCMNCYQCFRKTLLERVMMNHPLDDKFLDKLFNIKEVKKIIGSSPIFFENILAYITSHYNGKHKEMLSLKKKTRGDSLQVDWMNKYYYKSQEFLAPKYRNHVKKEIYKYVKPMNADDIKTMKNSFNEAYFKKAQG